MIVTWFRVINLEKFLLDFSSHEHGFFLCLNDLGVINSTSLQD